MYMLNTVLSQQIERPNLVIADANAQLLKHMYKPLKKDGYQIQVLNPHLHYSEFYNPLALACYYAKHDNAYEAYYVCNHIAKVIYQYDKGENAFFYDEATSLFNNVAMLLITLAYGKYNHVFSTDTKSKNNSDAWKQVTIANMIAIFDKLASHKYGNSTFLAIIRHHLLAQKQKLEKLTHESYHQSVYSTLLNITIGNFEQSNICGHKIAASVYTTFAQRLSMFQQPSLQKLTNQNSFHLHNFGYQHILKIHFDPKYHNQAIAFRFYDVHAKQIAYYKTTIDACGYAIIPIKHSITQDIKITMYYKKLNFCFTSEILVKFNNKHTGLKYSTHIIYNNRKSIQHMSLYVDMKPKAIFLLTPNHKDNFDILNTIFIDQIYHVLRYNSQFCFPQIKTGFVFSNLANLPRIPHLMNHICDSLEKSFRNKPMDIQYVFGMFGNPCKKDIQDYYGSKLRLVSHYADTITKLAGEHYIVSTANSLMGCLHQYYGDNNYPLHLLLNTKHLVEHSKSPNLSLMINELYKYALTYAECHPIPFTLVNHHIVVKDVTASNQITSDKKPSSIDVNGSPIDVGVVIKVSSDSNVCVHQKILFDSSKAQPITTNSFPITYIMSENDIVALLSE